ncbi:hypothetical protein APU01nite_16920 [Alkalibacterium putridalgicola]|uniref:Uncharacterized protein n=1 Tax=Alkalibacterium putridalgicola TaxID=426703 RepID=A0ABQ0UYM7_9LACT|nr:hypothetical protein APU01nite_16920 [Alkalibacterium putridalgicola]
MSDGCSVYVSLFNTAPADNQSTNGGTATDLICKLLPHIYYLNVKLIIVKSRSKSKSDVLKKGAHFVKTENLTHGIMGH